MVSPHTVPICVRRHRGARSKTKPAAETCHERSRNHPTPCSPDARTSGSRRRPECPGAELQSAGRRRSQEAPCGWICVAEAEWLDAVRALVLGLVDLTPDAVELHLSVEPV